MIRPFAHLVYATSHLSFVAFYSYNVTKDKWLVVYTRCENGRMVKQTWKGLQLLQKSTNREIGIICTCSILCRFHGWLIFARVIALFMFVWPCVHSHILCTQLVICLLSHFIRATSLAKNNQLRNRHNMCMLRSWPTKIPNMNKMWPKTND
jgi:hypothetical protein